MTSAVDAIRDAGWLEDIVVRFVAGPSAYLFGEETALLEVVDNRQPFPRVTPPWRRGVDEARDGAPAHARLATPEGSSAAPVLVNNVETFANVALIVRNGPDWFREIGTAESPGSLVCTIVGDVVSSGVGEFAMGTTLREAIEVLGGRRAPRTPHRGRLPGASGAVIAEELFDTSDDARSVPQRGHVTRLRGILLHRRLVRSAAGRARSRSFLGDRVVRTMHAVQRRRTGVDRAARRTHRRLGSRRRGQRDHIAAWRR